MFAQTIPNVEMSCGNKNTANDSQPTNEPPPTGGAAVNADKMIYLKVAIHFLLPTKDVTYATTCGTALNSPVLNYTGAGNFTETSDGYGNDYSGFQYAEKMIESANAMLSINPVPWRKDPSLSSTYYDPTPALPFRYVLVGVFFHRNDLHYKSSDKFSIHAAYDYDSTNVIDIYKAPGYDSGDLGGEALAYGGVNKAVVVDDYYTYIKEKCGGNTNWSLNHGIPGLLNHEIGHMLNLYHSWESDGCDDTPVGALYYQFKDENKTDICKSNQDNANCWAHNVFPQNFCTAIGNINPCANWANVSNNVMDYNGNQYRSYTPCQVEKMKKDITTNGGSYVKQCLGDIPPPNAFFWVGNDVFDICSGVKPIVSFSEMAVNESKFELKVTDLSNNKTFVIQTGSKVGNYDLAKLFNFSSGRSYKITLIVDNNASSCPSEYSKVIFFKHCTKVGNVKEPVFGLAVNNPFGTSILITADFDRVGTTKFQLINPFTSSIEVLQGDSFISVPDHYVYEFDTAELPAGYYVLQMFFNEETYYRNLIKIE